MLPLVLACESRVRQHVFALNAIGLGENRLDEVAKSETPYDGGGQHNFLIRTAVFAMHTVQSWQPVLSRH